MNKANKENKAMCDSCGFYFKDASFLTKHESGNKYCGACIYLGIKVQEIKKQVNPEEVDKMVEALFNTPPPKKSRRKSERHK